MRVAWVTPRYGTDVGGGAETLCRKVSEVLSARIEQTILTTCATSSETWANEYDPGETVENGVTVRRFLSTQPRDKERQAAAWARVSRRSPSISSQTEWIRAQGPHSPDLLHSLRGDHTSYDAVVFVPYLYEPTVVGIAIPGLDRRSVLVPCAHDEPALFAPVFRSVFARAAGFSFNTPEEREFVLRTFPVGNRPWRDIGLAVDAPPVSEGRRFTSAYGIDGPYVLCVGRVEVSKGSDQLLFRFREWRQRHPDLSLVFVGPLAMDLPRDEPGLVVTGFVDDQTKHDAIAGATLVVCPSRLESLSITTLEAWSHGRATLATAESAVLVGQSRRAQAGLWYRHPAEFHRVLDRLIEDDVLTRNLGRNGKAYTERFASWDRVRDLWVDLLGEVAERHRDWNAA